MSGLSAESEDSSSSWYHLAHALLDMHLFHLVMNDAFFHLILEIVSIVLLLCSILQLLPVFLGSLLLQLVPQHQSLLPGVRHIHWHLQTNLSLMEIWSRASIRLNFVNSNVMSCHVYETKHFLPYCWHILHWMDSIRQRFWYFFLFLL